MSFSIESLPKVAGATVAQRTIERSDLSADQVEVFDEVLRWTRDPNARQYLKMAGYAGTGKTTLVAALAKELEMAGERVGYVAFTGKAVNVMARKLRAAGVNGNCLTLHSLMYRPAVDDAGRIVGWERKPLEAFDYSFIVLDEASMVGADLWRDLLSYQVPVLAVGDHGQLPPVGNDVVNLMAIPDLRLEKIHRQAEGNPILALAQHVREGRSFRAFESPDPRVTFIPSVATVSSAVAADPFNFGAICYTNRTRVSLNRFIRNARGLVGDPHVGDVVMCLRNAKPVFNGMRGTVSAYDIAGGSNDTYKLAVDFADEGFRVCGPLWLPQFEMPKTIDEPGLQAYYKGAKPNLRVRDLGLLFDYGYAITCHKAQGSQFASVVLVYENLFKDADTRNRWLYTAVTRASDKLYVVRS